MVLRLEKLDELFLTAKNSYSKKRHLKLRNIIVFVPLVLLAFAVLSSFFIEKEEPTVRGEFNYLKDLPTRSHKLSYLKQSEYEYDDIAPSKISRSEVKSQRGFNKEALIGSKVAVKLLGRVVASSHRGVPIRAKVVSYKDDEDGYELDFKLKAGSVLLGQGLLDPLSERLHITFHSLLLKGRKIPIQAKAFMKDGTFGVKGRFNSGELKKYGARFGSNFIGGFSQGLKQKAITQTGAIFEPSNLSNAILAGLSFSFLDYAKDKSRKYENPTAKILIKNKRLFFVYFQ